MVKTECRYILSLYLCPCVKCVCEMLSGETSRTLRWSQGLLHDPTEPDHITDMEHFLYSLQSVVDC